MNDAEGGCRGGNSTFENVTYAHMCVNGNTDIHLKSFQMCANAAIAEGVPGRAPTRVRERLEDVFL